MATFTEQQRGLWITSSLGQDVLLLLGFSGKESISRLFTYYLELASETETIAAQDIIGQPVTWSVAHNEESPRYFNGVVSKFVAGGVNRLGLRTYRAEVVPWTWFLTRTTDCRIFQNQTTPDIIKAIFGAYGFSDFDVSNLTGSYAQWEYCVQYRETAFNFISRLMEHEGIFYFFRHEFSEPPGKHIMVLADSTSAYQDVPESPVKFFEAKMAAANQVLTWEHHFELRPGKWTRTDYNFQTPSNNLQTTTTTVVPLDVAKKYELFDYPGTYPTTAVGDPITKVRMEELEAGYEVVTGTSRCRSFTTCGKFQLEGHEVDAENATYMITSIQHSASEPSYGTSTVGGQYSNAFTCIPASVVFRPERITPKPIVQGVQTAVVVGPSGEEIYIDDYCRVKVQFFWDRLGKNDQNSSCWIRVAEVWAGKGWGTLFHPRIGQEVIVDFLEGDPDRPIITGRVYNAEQMPPHGPAQMTQSTIISRSTKQGGTGNFNEIMFEDKKGSELLYIHAEKDQTIEVENDESHTVGHDRTKTIDHDETTHVKHDRTETVDNNETITIKNNRTETVQKDESITIQGNRTENVSKDESITISGGRTVSVGKSDSLSVSQNLSITANNSITITTGAASISMKSDGTITISGSSISIQGNAKVQLQGPQITSQADAINKVSGALVNVEASGINTIKGALVKVN